MGADSFVHFYGIRIVLSEEESDAVETRSDDRIRRARKAGLDTYFGRLTDGEPSFLFIGTNLGVFGVENETYRAWQESELQETFVRTREKLSQAGFDGPVALHLQLEAQY